MGAASPDIKRLLSALRHRRSDRVPNFEILFNAPAVSHLLGRTTSDSFWQVPPADAVRIAQSVGQDAVVCSMTWAAAGAGSILSHEDVDRIVPPDPAEQRPKLQAYIDAAAGTGVGVVARLSGPMTLTYMSLGPVPIESFMYKLYDDPELVERLMDIHLDYHLRLIETIRDLPYDLYYIGDDISSTRGPLIRPADLARFWAPRTEKLVQAALATDRPVMFHCCGKLEPILPYLVDWGVSAVHPIQPGANDIYAIHDEYGDRLALVGNIDVAGALSHGTPEEVRRDTKEHIERLAGDGGYVVCSSHSIIDSVPPENYRAMVRAAQEFGVYS